jgi:hypothetical protein
MAKQNHLTEKYNTEQRILYAVNSEFCVMLGKRFVCRLKCQHAGTDNECTNYKIFHQILHWLTLSYITTPFAMW